MEKVTVDKQFSLKAIDFLKGIYVSVFAPIIIVILEQFEVGNFKLNWAELGGLVATTLIGYLLKNYFRPTKVTIEQPKESEINTIKSMVK